MPSKTKKLEFPRADPPFLLVVIEGSDCFKFIHLVTGALCAGVSYCGFFFKKAACLTPMFTPVSHQQGCDRLRA